MADHSAELIRANEELKRLRIQTQASKPLTSSAAAVACLVENSRGRQEVKRGTLRTITSLLAEIANKRTEPQPQETGFPHLVATSIKLYPSIGMAALSSRKTGFLRLWLCMRHLDSNGSGKVGIPDLRAFLSDVSNRFRGVGWSQTGKLLRAGNHRYWHLPDTGGRPDYTGVIYYRSSARVAAELGVNRLSGLPVRLPVTALQCLQQFNAELFHAFHSGRKQTNPISQRTIYRLYGLPERTQRHYLRLTKLQAIPNLAIAAQTSQAGLQQAAWQHRGAFSFYDQAGLQGPANSHLLAWRLPNSYQGSLPQTAKGNQRKINRQLATLADKAGPQGQWQGTTKEPVDRLFFDDGSQAGKAYNRQPEPDRYFPSNSHTRPGKMSIWHCLPGLFDDIYQR